MSPRPGGVSVIRRDSPLWLSANLSASGGSRWKTPVILNVAKNPIGIIYCLLLIITIFNLKIRSVRAQNSLGITAIPPRLEITIDPNEVITTTIKVRNESNSVRFIDTITKDILVTDDKGTPIQLEENNLSDNRWAAASWIQTSPSQFKLEPGETKGIQVTIIAPENALPGGHYAVILHSPQNETTLNESGTAINTSVGSLIYITVPGDINQEAKVSKFSIPKFSEYGPIDIKTTIVNLSDIHISPIGHIAITNLLGQNTANLLLKSANIFPNTSRLFQNSLDKKWLLGRYKAQLQSSFGTDGQALVTTAFFWVIPWRLILLISTIIILLVVLYKLTRNQSRKNPTEPKHDSPELEKLKTKYKDQK